MNILLFKTNINTDSKVNSLKPILDSHYRITSWSVDTMDVDNVLRIVTKQDLDDTEIIELIENLGYSCSTLTDELHESDS